MNISEVVFRLVELLACVAALVYGGSLGALDAANGWIAVMTFLAGTRAGVRWSQSISDAELWKSRRSAPPQRTPR